MLATKDFQLGGERTETKPKELYLHQFAAYANVLGLSPVLVLQKRRAQIFLSLVELEQKLKFPKYGNLNAWQIFLTNHLVGLFLLWGVLNG